MAPSSDSTTPAANVLIITVDAEDQKWVAANYTIGNTETSDGKTVVKLTEANETSTKFSTGSTPSPTGSNQWMYFINNVSASNNFCITTFRFLSNNDPKAPAVTTEGNGWANAFQIDGTIDYSATANGWSVYLYRTTTQRQHTNIVGIMFTLNTSLANDGNKYMHFALCPTWGSDDWSQDPTFTITSHA